MLKRLQNIAWMPLLIATVCVEPVGAQNVSNYAGIPQPLLFLLREPAVHEDLALARKQLSQLTALNEKYDADLLATRNKTRELAQSTIDRVLEASRQGVQQILTPQQQLRLQQITYRLRGIPFVLASEVSQKLRLSDRQRTAIEKVVVDTNKRVAAEQKKLSDGQTSQQKANLVVNRILRDQQKSVLSLLSPEQQQQLPALLGRKFDPAKLGKVAFKAPELSDSGVWINTDALQLTDLRGKVIALHFWAFG